MHCKICNDKSEDTICSACREKLAITPMPPPRRPPFPCPRCGGRRFLRAAIRELAGGNALSNQPIGVPIPSCATWDIKKTAATYVGFVRIEGAGTTLRLDQPRGMLSRYICGGCGFVEVYCDDVDSVPIGEEFMTDIVDYEVGPER